MYRHEIKHDGKLYRIVCNAHPDNMLTCQFTDMTFAKFVCKFYSRNSHKPSVVNVGISMIKLLDHLDIPHEFIDKVETTSPDAMKLALITKWLDGSNHDQ